MGFDLRSISDTRSIVHISKGGGHVARVTFVVPDETRTRILKVAERDKVSEGLVIRELIDMALDARENWQRAPKLQLPEER